MSAMEGGVVRDAWGRLRRGWGWVVGEYVGLAALVALGLLWTRIAEKSGAQVALTLALPVVVLAAFLWLQAGLLRSFSRPGVGEAETGEEEEVRRVSLAWGAATLLVWLAAGWGLWLCLDQGDEHLFQWAGYLNSKLDAHARAGWGSYPHLLRDLGWAEWVLRWVVVPGVLIPAGVGSALWGLRRLPWRRVARVWVSPTWWPVVLVWALVGEAWPQTWFVGEPHGAVRAQVGRVVLKVAAAYLLAVTGWVKVLGWAAMRVSPRARARRDGGFQRLGLGGLGLEGPVRERREETIETPRPGVTGRPLPQGGEDGSGHA